MTGSHFEITDPLLLFLLDDAVKKLKYLAFQFYEGLRNSWHFGQKCVLR